MKHPAHSILKFLAIISGFVLIVICGFLGFITLTEYNPKGVSFPEIQGRGISFDSTKKEFTFFTWNIGYAGLDSKMDFFYDGGRQVIPDLCEFQRTFSGIKEMILSNSAVDFIFFQELDIRSKRAYHTNELQELSKNLPEYFYIFGKNYDCQYVPIPLYQPMGKVISGIATFSRYQPVKSEMVPLESNFSWPRRLAMLKRCFLIMKFSLDNGKELVVINIHNSAYDFTGELREKEIRILSIYLKQEFRKGNYVIAGGDWNSNPPGYKPQKVVSGDLVVPLDNPVDSSLFPGWQFVFDSRESSNRFTDMPYLKGKTRTTLIDFFLVSPNIMVKKVHTISTNFANSDHQPVMLKIQLKK
ncbi:MAG: hypothetical protein PHF97_01325 [Bacteroidales bacterium]|nr:hypothetical protein [Bacteroidales bacterium]MDD4602430.1 hypothetical protein [Bacteroidales bacterium]